MPFKSTNIFLPDEIFKKITIKNRQEGHKKDFAIVPIDFKQWDCPEKANREKWMTFGDKKAAAEMVEIVLIGNFYP